MKKGRKCTTLFLALLIVITSCLVTLPPMEVKANGITYYVSSSAGNNNFDGKSQDRAWRTLDRVQQTVLRPGDKVLLKCGDTWTNDALVLNGAGTYDNPILISSYVGADGNTAMPIITNPKPDYDTDFTYPNPSNNHDPRTWITVAIKAKQGNQGYHIKGIEISRAQYGIIAYNFTSGRAAGMTIEDCYIHDIYGARTWVHKPFQGPNGTVAEDNPEPLLKSSIGILVGCMNNVVIKNNVVVNIGGHVSEQINGQTVINKSHGVGISVMSAFNYTLVENNYVYNAAGHGIDMNVVQGGIVQNNRVLRTGYPNGIPWGTTGIMLTGCRDVVIQDCEINDVFDANPGYDGMGIDFESNNFNCAAIRNYIRNCYRSAFLVFNNFGFNNMGLRILDNTMENNGWGGNGHWGTQKGTEFPAFLVHIGNPDSLGTIAGNNIKKVNSGQYLNRTGPDERSFTPSNNMPQNYVAMNNMVFNENESFPAPYTMPIKDWVASPMFSPVQGGDQWYYQSFNSSTQAYTDAVFNGAAFRWDGAGGVMVGANWQQPMNGYSTVRKWVAPICGYVTVTSKARKKYSGGNGVTATIFLYNRTGKLAEQTIAGSDITEKTLNTSTIYVNAGTPIFFEVSANGDATSDETIWDPTVTITPASNWTASTNFSYTNGNSQWSYKEMNPSTMEVTPMTFDMGGYWKGSSINAQVGPSWQLPSNSFDSARVWVSPRAGLVNITGTARMLNAGGDGVIVKILKNNAVVLQKNIDGNNTTTGVNMPATLQVEAGDAVSFVVNKRGTTVNDYTVWDPTITISEISQWTASAQFDYKQGALQWEYVTPNADVPQYMKYDAVNNRWYYPLDTGCLVGPNWQHPGNGDSVRKWTAPRDGFITISSTVQVPGALSGDGVMIKIVRNWLRETETVIYGPLTITDAGVKTVNVTSPIPVKAGETICFVVNKRANASYDTTLWDPMITYN